jgi:lysophospholipase L1-like esterase
MLWRIENGELDGVNPKVIVILAGTNNIGTTPGDEAKVKDIVCGYEKLIATCRTKAPGAKIVITAIFPRNDAKTEEDRKAVLAEIAAVNAGMSKYADFKTIYLVDVNDRLADGHGSLFEGITIDRLHLGARGYEVWAEGLRPILTQLLGPRAETDQAPPPTGDPSASR